MQELMASFYRLLNNADTYISSPGFNRLKTIYMALGIVVMIWLIVTEVYKRKMILLACENRVHKFQPVGTLGRRCINCKTYYKDFIEKETQMFCKHDWIVRTKTYTRSARETGRDEEFWDGMTTILYECSRCKRLRKVEMKGKEISS